MPAAAKARPRKRPAAKPPSLYKRLGGAAGLAKAIDLFYEKVLADSKLAPYFDMVDMNRLKGQQRAFFAQALGGPAHYKGADMTAAHIHLEISQAAFDRTAGHLVAALAELGAPKAAIDEVVGAIAPLAAQIVQDSATSASRRSLAKLADKVQGEPSQAMPTRTHSSGGAAVAEPPVQTEHASYDQQSQVEALLRSQAVIEFDLDGTILTANDKFLQAVGYTLGEIEGKHHRIFCERAFTESPAYGAFWRTLNEGKYQAGDFKRLAKDGREIWLRASYNPLLDPDGRPYKVVKYASEITEAKLRELASDRVQSMMENSPINTMFADRDLVIQYMNPASRNTLRKLESFLPVKADQMVGQCIDIFHKNPAHQRKMLADPNNLPHKAYIQVGPETLDLLVSAIRGSNGEYLGAMVTWDVVTERLKLEQEAARVQSMMENSPINTMYADTDLVIRYMNPASTETLKTLQQYLPVRVEDMIGQNIDVFHKNPAHQRKLLADPNNLPRQANIKVGPETLDLLVCAIRDKKGEYLGAMVTWEVITERLAAEQREKEMAEREREQAENLRQKVDSMLAVVQQAKDGDLTAQIQVSGEDAIGQMGHGLGGLLGDLREAMTQIAENAQHVASSAEELTAVSQQMAGNAEETATQAGVVSAASEEVTRNVQTAATAAEEMSASIREIAKSSGEAAKIAKQAVTVADSANKTIKELGDSSVEIGKVIKVITSIAQQTNLLALNATIEAARAGEAGKGFAVVANEVKELAKQTAQATEDISQKIEAIQAGSTGAVEAIAEVGTIINQINDISNTIASSVEEQTATTNEISRNVSEAARGSAEISENVTGVATAASSTTQGANDTLQAAKGLSEMAAQLQQLVGRFKL
ncbi:MAG: PAS domain-containing protein [Bryobacterales bacterium]|nr:PAS domain-containing protein [Acidobacteriota bacterium]MCB9383138.1 PAS domain-containing protein [Bryobacterales bacterium]